MAYLDTHGLNTLWTKIKNTFVGEAPNDNKRYIRKNKTWEVIQHRNIFVSTEDPTSADGNDGDIWIKYTP